MEQFHALSVDEQDDLLCELVAYARRLLRHTCGGLPSDWDAEDLVMDLLERYLNGTRSVNESVSLRTNLFGGVRSAVSARRKKASRVAFELGDSIEHQTGWGDPESAAIVRRWNTMVRDALDTIACDDDDVLELVSILEETGNYTVSDLMEQRGWSEKEARRVRRKFSRALVKAESMAKEVARAQV